MSRLLVADGEAWGLVRLKIGCFTTLFITLLLLLLLVLCGSHSDDSDACGTVAYCIIHTRDLQMHSPRVQKIFTCRENEIEQREASCQWAFSCNISTPSPRRNVFSFATHFISVSIQRFNAMLISVFYV